MRDFCYFFFFQAEDGIRDRDVTGVQTCALPILLGLAEQEAKEFGPEYGLFGAPAMHAFGARRHMARYGTTREHFGAIAVAFREHAARNPQAQKRTPITLEDYFGARLIVDPFGLFDCSLVSDGAGAVVIT